MGWEVFGGTKAASLGPTGVTAGSTNQSKLGGTTMKFLSKLTVLAAMSLVLAGTATAQTLRAHGPEPGGGSYIATVAIGKMAEKHADIPMQLQAGQTGTRSLVQLAQGKIDFTLLPVPAVNLFKNGQAMYKNMTEAPRTLQKPARYPRVGVLLLAFRDL